MEPEYGGSPDTEPPNSPLGPWPMPVGFTAYERLRVTQLREALHDLVHTLNVERFLSPPTECTLVQYRQRDTTYFNTADHRRALSSYSESLRVFLEETRFALDGPSTEIWERLSRLVRSIAVAVRRTESPECAAVDLCRRIERALHERRNYFPWGFP
jgi:hypothetical protein